MTKKPKIENTSGIIPIEYKALVLIDKSHEKIGSIFIPDDVKDQKDMAEVKGTLVAHGGKAFEDFGEPRPMAGDRIMIAKYAGKLVKGADDKEYRIVSDKDVSSIVVDERAKVSEVA